MADRSLDPGLRRRALRLAPHERLAAWALTGTPGRVAAFALDFALALRRLAARRIAGKGSLEARRQ